MTLRTRAIMTANILDDTWKVLFVYRCDYKGDDVRKATAYGIDATTLREVGRRGGGCLRG